MQAVRRLRGAAAMMCLALTAIAATAPLAQTLPPGFASTFLHPVSAPTALAPTPDGRILIAQQTGQLRVAAGGSLLTAPALTLGANVLCSNSERGLLGVAVDPQFGQNGFIYLFYTFRRPPPGDCSSNTVNSPVNRVSRFVLQMDNTVLAGSETVLVDNIPSPNGNHNAGDLHFGKDGYLYISTGDGATAVTPDVTIHHVYAAGGNYTAMLRVRDSHFAFAAPLTFTISAGNAPPSADIDANGKYDALTDGLLLLRHLFGLSGPALTAGALGSNALRTDSGEIGAFVASQGLAFDVDGNGSVDALTDALLAIRYLLGLRGSALVAGAVGVGAVRTTAAQIEPFIASLLR